MEEAVSIDPKKLNRLSLIVILSIILFLIVYFILVVAAACLAILCWYAALALLKITNNSNAIATIPIGIGILIIGFSVFFYLIKFIFKKKNLNTVHFIEITEEDEPKLFEIIKNIAAEVNTSIPQKVFISPFMNAAVIYNDNFWNLFIPAKKNLMLGLGLVNYTSAAEFKGILAHEFGHFAQGKMFVSSYVYYIKYILSNILHEDYNFLTRNAGWFPNIIGIIFSFGLFSALIIEWIKRILRHIYDLIIKSHSKLMIQLEFHADEVAANISGSKAFITFLLRSDLANYAFNSVMNYYKRQNKKELTTRNIYPQHRFVMSFLASKNKIKLKNNLPDISLELRNRFRKSKLVIEDQWASHPEYEDRVLRLEKLNIIKEGDNGESASEFFSNIEALEEKCTERLFSSYGFTNSKKFKETKQFIAEYSKEYNKNHLNEIFNNYYTEKYPLFFEPDQLEPIKEFDKSVSDLFSEEMLDLVYTSIALEDDIWKLKLVSKGDINVKSFDYEGIKYYKKHCMELIKKLETELEEVNIRIKTNDIEIYRFFLSLAEKQGKESCFKDKYQEYFNFYKEYEIKYNLYLKVLKATEFISKKISYSKIEKNFEAFEELEQEFKIHVNDLLRSDIYKDQITKDLKKKLRDYLSDDWEYFYRPDYDNEALDVFYYALHSYQFIVSETFIKLKKELLDFKVELLEYD